MLALLLFIWVTSCSMELETFVMTCKAVARRLSMATSTTFSNVLLSFSKATSAIFSNVLLSSFLVSSTRVSFPPLVMALSLSAAATFALISFFSWSGVIPRTPTNPSHSWVAPSPSRERGRTSTTTLSDIVLELQSGLRILHL